MDKKMNVAMYMRVGNDSQIEKTQENEMKGKMELLQIYQLEDNFKSKLDKLINKIPTNQSKVAIYTYDEDCESKSKKLEKIKGFCQKNKLEITKVYFDISFVNCYRKKDLTYMFLDAIQGVFNTVIVLNSKDMGESSLINTHIINSIFTKNGIRFIDIEQKVDTNLDETLIAYENPVYRSLMDYIESEEHRMRGEKIKLGRKMSKNK